MTSQEFCYWLQGLLELQPDLKELNEAQVKMIRGHLGYVFTHIQQPIPAPQTQLPNQIQPIWRAPSASIC